MVNYFILGSEGFLGISVKEALSKTKGVKIVSADISLCKKNIRSENFYCVDIRDTKKIVSVCEKEKIKVIINCAGIFSDTSVKELYEINYFASRALLNALIGRKYTIVLLGSAAEYGKTFNKKITEDFPLTPISEYGTSKACQSFFVKQFCYRNLFPNTIIARPFTMIGPNMKNNLFFGSVAMQIAAIKHNRNAPIVEVGSLNAYRDIVPVNMVAESLIALSKSGKHGEVYNICSGIPIKVRSILERMIQYSERKIQIKISPARFKENEIAWSIGSNKKISAITGIHFNKRELHKYIASALQWYYFHPTE